MAMGVPHYYKDGKPLGAGGMGQYHKMKDGTLHSGKTHTKSSKRLFHFNELLFFDLSTVNWSASNTQVLDLTPRVLRVDDPTLGHDSTNVNL